MTEDVHLGRPGAGQPVTRRRRLRWIVLAGAALLIAVLVGPRMVNLNRYKSWVARLIATALGRPVELSSVEMRLLPWPAFELSNLSVAEDPAYGAEPVLHASTVTASIRFLPLWRGRLEIGSISVDDASLNLVHGGPGKWNLDPLFRTAAVKAGSAENSAEARRAARLPYLEATNSRINIKDGAEKLPFSLINTDFELWQESPGEWHIRLRGQPARTDVSLYQEDTGVLRLEASVGRAPALRDMPIHVDLDWREAQLGQLARLLTGSDPGWRGDLTGEMHVDGSANAAQVRTRLQATGVHRAEFAPAEAMDFDANCGFLYHYSRRALENLVCDSPLGDGRIHLTGGMTHESQPPELSVELDRVPVAAGLEALRMLRSDVPVDLEAGGTVSGKIAFAPAVASGTAQPPALGHARKDGQPEQGPPGGSLSGRSTGPSTGSLTGSLTVNDFALSGAGLTPPVQIPKIVLEPSEGNGSAEALVGRVTLPAGGTAPLAVEFLLAAQGYQVTLRGQANLQRARELLRTAGIAGPAGLDAMAGQPLTLDLHAEGAWLPAEAPVTETAAVGDGAAAPETDGVLADSLSGTVTVRDANWKADFLAHGVEIAQATLRLGNGVFRWDPIEFSYGPVKGTASLSVPVSCAEPDGCPPQFEVHFGNLDASTLETAILGVREQGTLLSDLIEKLHPESAPLWPRLEGSVSADSLVLGPVTLKQPEAELQLKETGAEVTHLAAGLLGGALEASGEFDRAASQEDKPAYAFDCQLTGANAQAVGRLLGETWSGGTLKAQGAIRLAGYTDGELASSATGKLHFEWRHGAVSLRNGADPAGTPMAAALKRFDLWTADAAIGDGAITLGENKVEAGGRSQPVKGEVTFGAPPAVSFSAGNGTRLHQGAHGARGNPGDAADDADAPHAKQ
jgi:AsmA family/AsmA-like C-terminal region